MTTSEHDAAANANTDKFENRTKTLFHNVRLLDPASGLDQLGNLLIDGSRIAGFGPTVDTPPAARMIDGKGYCLAPGLVDMRVQFGEPGAEHKERLESGVRAAAAGGVTSVALLPNTDPPIDEPAIVEFIARRARKLRSTKLYPYGALTKKLQGQEMAEIGLLMEAGAVAFTDAEDAVTNAQTMRRILSYAGSLGALIVQHPEEPRLRGDGVMNEGLTASRLGLAGIPACAEVMMIERDLRLVALTGARYHAAHISTAESVEAIRKAKAQGLNVTCETTPHHLALNELEVEGYRTFAKVSPPLRSEEDRLAIVEGLKDGTIDVIASDHCPQDQDGKRLPFAQAAIGAIGVETMLPISLRLYHSGDLSLLELLAKMTVNPAKLLGLEAGQLEIGAPADLVLFDPDRPWKIMPDNLHSLAKNTAFEGSLVTGQVLQTLVDGRTVFLLA